MVTETRADQDGYSTAVTAQNGNVTTDKIVKGLLTNNESISYTNTCDSAIPAGVANTRLTLFILLIMIVLTCVLYYIKKRSF